MYTPPHEASCIAHDVYTVPERVSIEKHGEPERVVKPPVFQHEAFQHESEAMSQQPYRHTLLSMGEDRARLHCNGLSIHPAHWDSSPAGLQNTLAR